MHNPSTTEAQDELGSAGTQIAPELPAELLDDLPSQGPIPHFYGRLVFYGLVVFGLALVARWVQPVSAGAPWPGLLTLPSDLLPAPLPPVWHQAVSLVAQATGESLSLAAFGLSTLAQAALLATMAVGAMALLLLFRQGDRPGCQHWIFGHLAVYLFGFIYKVVPLASPSAFGSPAMLSAALAAAALLALGLFLYTELYAAPGQSTSTGKTPLLVAALCLGAACVDQPYFLVLVPFGLLMCLFRPGHRTERLLLFFIPLIFVLAWPALRYIQSGGNPSALLAHLLRLPFPDASFSPGYFELSRDKHLLLSLAAFVVIGILLMPRTPGLRRAIGLLLLGALLLGPAMPLLANPPTGAPLLVDYTAPLLLAWGLLMIAFWVALLARLRPREQALVSTVVVLGLLADFRLVITSDNHTPTKFQVDAQALLAEVPEGATVVAGNTEIAATFWGFQHIDRLRPDLRIVPLHWLGMPGARRAAGERLALSLSDDFPSAEAVDRWATELPLHAAALQAGDPAAFEAGLSDFAAWDLATLDSPQASVWFLGVQANWLLTRGERRGAFLVFPPTGETKPAEELDVEVPWAQEINDVFKAEALTQRRDALRELQHPFNVPAPVDDPIRDTVTDALRAARAGDGKLTDDLRADTDKLWRADKLQLLQSVYEVLTQAPSPDLESWYQLAAVHAQLGHWRETTTALGKWMAAFPAGNGAAFGRINGDGRFAVYLRKAGGGPVPLPDDL